MAWWGPGVARAPRALGRRAVGVGACHIRPAERPPPSAAPGPHRCLYFPHELWPPCFLMGPAPATESAGGARGSARAAGNPLAHHRLVALIIVTR